MSVQLKAGVSDAARYFNLGGCDYEKGGWSVIYVGKEVDEDGVIVNEDEVQVGIGYKSDPDHSRIQDPILWSEYVDSAGSPYASLQLFLSALGTLAELGSTGGGGSGGPATGITVDTSSFNNNLSAADDTVQKALDTIDDFVLSGASDVVVEKTFADTGYTPSNREFVVVNASGGETTINLAALASSVNHTLGVSKDENSVNKVIIKASGAELINNANTFEITTDDQSVTLRGGPSKWSIW